VIIKPGVSHRFGIVFRGENLSDELEDADPHKDNRPLVPVVPKNKGAEKTAAAINTFVAKVMEVLKDQPVANGVLLRGFSKKPDMPLFPDKYKMASLAITTYPMYRGIAKLLGMKVENEPKNYDDMVAILAKHYEKYQFFFMHVKETDVAGEDGNFEEKVKAIEAVDTITPCPMKGHSWHPVPLLIVSETGERDGISFDERNCIGGSIGTIPSKELMALALAHGSKLDKFGA
jgi:2,3-bisphosphoglycerate-independent phosphoglycerate mutase